MPQHALATVCLNIREPQQQHVFKDPMHIFQCQHDWTMSLGGAGSQEVDWEALFQKEALGYIQKSIASMEDEIYGEFKLRLGHDITMSNY